MTLKTLFCILILSASTAFGAMDGDSTAFFRVVIFKDGAWVEYVLTFEQWQAFTGEDLNSKEVLVEPGSDSLFVNATFTDQVMNLGPDAYRDVDGTIVTGSFVLPPCSSKLLFRDGGILPITIASFGMILVDGQAVATFTVLTERAVYCYSIQRHLVSGGAWTSCGTILPLGPPHTYSFTDSTLSAGVWKYRIEEVDLNGKVTDFGATAGLTDVIGLAVAVKSPVESLEYALLQNYPNPFSSTTNIAYMLKEQTNVKLTVYDILGRRVSIVVNERQGAGRYIVRFSGLNLVSGEYLYRLETPNFEKVSKMLLLK